MEGILIPPRPRLLARLRLWLTGAAPESDSERPLEDAALVLRRHGDAILRLAFSYLHRRDEAEDVLQDTLLQYIQKAPPFSSQEHEKAWLLRVAANLSKNRLSYWKRHPQEELSDLLPGESEDPALAAVWDCVKALPPKYRAVIHLYILRAVQHRRGRRTAGEKGVHRALPAGPRTGTAPGYLGGGRQWRLDRHTGRSWTPCP